MNKRNMTGCIAVLILGCALGAAEARAQSSSTFAVGLDGPEKTFRTQLGNILVAESGHGPNTGRISIVDTNGVRRTLVDGLPSGFAPPEFAPSGPAAIAMRGRTLYVVIGAGDGTIAGAAPASEVPNPSPSSPILSSVLAIHVSAKVERSTAGFTLSSADHAALAGGDIVKLRNSPKDKITVRVLADFPNFESAPRPDQPDNVRASNPFGVAIEGRDLFVVDASLNRVVRIDSGTGDSTLLTSFAPIQNPLPFGPPVIDYVPDSVRISGGGLLVTNLTGFPFPPGGAQVRRIDLATGAEETLIGGLTSAMDVISVDHQGGGTEFYVLEFSANMLADPAVPGRLLHFESATATPTVVAEDLITPVGLERDSRTGDVFVTELFTGLLKRISGL